MMLSKKCLNQADIIRLYEVNLILLMHIRRINVFFFLFLKI